MHMRAKNYMGILDLFPSEFSRMRGVCKASAARHALLRHHCVHASHYWCLTGGVQLMLLVHLLAACTRLAAAPTTVGISCAAAEAKLCGASKHGGTQPTDCEVCIGLHISELASAGCNDADTKKFCDPTLSFGGGKLHFEFDETFSIKAITTSKGGGKSSKEPATRDDTDVAGHDH